MFDFVDIKVMFMLVINKINFNISYLILLNMINSSSLGFMPYGLLLTSLFDYVGISLQYPPAKRIHALISQKHANDDHSVW